MAAPLRQLSASLKRNVPQFNLEKKVESFMLIRKKKHVLLKAMWWFINAVIIRFREKIVIFEISIAQASEFTHMKVHAQSTDSKGSNNRGFRIIQNFLNLIACA